MRWPWQRPRDREAQPAEEVLPPARPHGQWRGVEPLRPVTPAAVGTAEPLGFVRTLSTRWQVPSALEPLGHEVSPAAPAGTVPVAGSPVVGYADPPELVWAAVPEPPDEPAASAVRRIAGRPSPQSSQHPVPGQDGARPDAGAGTSALAARPIDDDDVAVPAGAAGRPLVGDHRLGPDGRGPTAPRRDDVPPVVVDLVDQVVGDPTTLLPLVPARRSGAPAPGADVEDAHGWAGGAPVLERPATARPPVTPAAPPGEDATATADRPVERPTEQPAEQPTQQPAEQPQDVRREVRAAPEPLEAPASGAEPVLPQVAVAPGGASPLAPVRPVVGQRPALVRVRPPAGPAQATGTLTGTVTGTAPLAGADTVPTGTTSGAAGADLAVPAWFPGGDVAAVAPQPPADPSWAPTAPSPGLGVPEWFSGGAIRPRPPQQPEESAGPAVPTPSAPATFPDLGRRRGRSAPVTPYPGPADGAAPPDAGRGPRRVPWPAEVSPSDASPGDALPPDPWPPDPSPPDPSPPDPSLPDLSRADPSPAQGRPTDARGDFGDARAPGTDLDPLGPAAARPAPPWTDVPEPRQEAWPHAVAAPSPWADAAPAQAARRFRVGPPLPRPAAARVAAPSGLAELAAAARAASADVLEDEPHSARPDASQGGDPPADRLRGPGLLPSDLGLPDVVDLPADRAPGRPVPEDEDDEDDEDDDVGSAPSVDELYERVRDRLRHELIVDRERAALLAD